MGADNSGSLPADESLRELRRILGSEETERIQRLEHRLDTAKVFAEDVGRVLPEAVLLRARSDKTLTTALQGPVTEALHRSVRKNPQPLVDAVSPIIGPAIRKAVASAIRGAVQGLERALQYSLSPRSLKWRLDAWRTGRPFAEIVLLKTLEYRVEQALLIHQETGLLLRQVVAAEVASKDPELVSAMLTAIQDFVRDSFDASDEDTLEEMRVGDFTVWIVRGRHSVLATVIRGTAPEELREVMRRATEHVESDMAEDLAEFDGDAERFEIVDPYLEACLVKAEAKKKRSELSRIILFFLGIGLVLWIGWLIMGWYGNRQHWADYLDRLKQEPGIVVTSTDKRGGKWHVTGLRDPLTKDPMTFLEGLEAEDVEGHWQAYQALEPPFVLARAKRTLRPPGGVTLSLRGPTLVATGEAPHAWLADANRLARSIAGVDGLDASGVENTDLRAFETARKALENKAVPVPDEVVAVMEFKDVSGSIRRLIELAEVAGMAIRIELHGPDAREILGKLKETGVPEGLLAETEKKQRHTRLHIVVLDENG